MNTNEKYFIDERIGKSGTVVRLVAYSKSKLNPSNIIATFECEYWRAIHSEIMTHRCLVGDTNLVFDLPSNYGESCSRKYEITIEDFYNKWNYGSSERPASRFKKYDLEKLEDNTVYSAKQAASIIGMKSPTNLRCRCRSGRIPVQNPNKTRNEDFEILGKDIIADYKSPRNYKQDIKKRLQDMNLRILNEDKNSVEHTKITDIWKVGEEQTFKLLAGNYSITGTKDHPILTTTGWKELGMLTTDDYIIVVSQGRQESTDDNAYKHLNGRWTQTFNRNILPVLLKKQGGKCAHCGKKHSDGPLEVHHVVPVHENPSRAFDESNVIAVCNDCHHNFYHKKQGWQTGNQLIGKPVKVEAIIPQGVQDVYDLSVESEFHNFVANDIVVHNCLSRNASSSRAVNVDFMRDQAINNTAYPNFWGINQAGMQSYTEHEEPLVCKWAWDHVCSELVYQYDMLKKLNLHKQIINRILEPVTKIKTIITATEFDNFFYLRLQKDVEPNMRELAEMMKDLLDNNTAEELSQGQWHTPYVQHDHSTGEFEYVIDGKKVSKETALAVSTSCCAQVSYRKIDYSKEKAMSIYDKLHIGTSHGHHSPTEHQATPMKFNVMDDIVYPESWEDGVTHMDKHHNYWSGNFKGFIQHRQLITNNACTDYEATVDVRG